MMKTIIIIVIGAALYFLPTIIGAVRHKRNLAAIFLLNLLLGWTVIGWIIALIWSLTVERD
ncbi:superinfection immunity protein [Chloroflexota bacterium]